MDRRAERRQEKGAGEMRPERRMDHAGSRCRGEFHRASAHIRARGTVTPTALVVLALCAGLAGVSRAAELVPHLGVTRPVEGESEAKVSGGLALRGTIAPMLEPEVAISYRSESRFDDQLRLRMWPITGSLYVSPIPALYVGAGVVWYHTTFDYADEVPLEDETRQDFGIHLGGGAEFFLIRHAAIFVDYRYRFVRFGTPGEDDQPINIPGSKILPGLDKLKVSHQGSMWTTGVAFYF